MYIINLNLRFLISGDENRGISASYAVNDGLPNINLICSDFNENLWCFEHFTEEHGNLRSRAFLRPILLEKCLISTSNREAMWKETLSRINHWCIPVEPRVNRILIMTLVVFLLFYCISSIYQVVLFDTSLYYAAPYIAWIAIGFLIALRYTTNPNAAIGLYLLIFGADRLIFEYMLVVYELSPDIIDVILGISMMVSGALWILSKVRTRFLLLVSTVYFGYVGMQFLIENIDDLIEDSVDLIVLNLSFIATSLMYLLLIVILLCNDPPYRKGATFKANS